MELIIFVGLQASGKSTFFKQYFYDTHIRINLDMLKRRHRENILINACFESKQSFVVDNTNPTVKDRERYIPAAKKAGFKIKGYFFMGNVEKCLERNANRLGKANLPPVAIYAAAKKMQSPKYTEGFDEIYFVSIDEKNKFIIKRY